MIVLFNLLNYCSVPFMLNYYCFYSNRNAVRASKPVQIIELTDYYYY